MVACIKMEQIHFFLLGSGWTARATLLLSGLSMTLFIACSVGFLSVGANVISSRSFIRPVMFDLELEWTVGVGGGGENLHSSTSTLLLLIFDRRPPPQYKFLSLPSLPLPLKSKMVAIVFVQKISCTRSPKLSLFFRLPLSLPYTCVVYHIT